MKLYVNAVHDANHLKNLYAHMNRTSRKYDAIRNDVEVFVAKELTTAHTKNMAHVVMEFDTFNQARLAAQYVANHLGKACYAVTAVGGAQPNGTIIYPCIHIIYDVDYTPALTHILNQINF